MRAGRVAVGEVRAPDSDASGAFTAKIYWRLYAERLVAPKRRKVHGAFMPKTVWLLNGESSQPPCAAIRSSPARAASFTRAPSCAAHSSSSVTQLSNCADSRAGFTAFAESYVCDDRRALTGSRFVHTGCHSTVITASPIGSQSMTIGTSCDPRLGVQGRRRLHSLCSS